MEFYDNTRVSGHKACPRRYYFRHVRNWDTQSSPYKANFGNCWHSAMDEIWPLMCGKHIRTDAQRKEILEQGIKGFSAEWARLNMPSPQFEPERLEAQGAYNPSTAISMLYEYILQAHYLERLELVSVERPFAVPLKPDDDKLWYCGRIDKVVRGEDGKILIVDHKSTGQYAKSGFFRNTFTESFSPNSQIDGYAYASFIQHGKEYGGKVWIEAALVHKNVHDGFAILPVYRDIKQLDAWLWETINEIERIQKYTFIEKQYQVEDQPYLDAFPKNTGNCWSYGSPCPYTDLCKSWSNPVNKPTPDWLVESAWSPFDHNQLEKIGMEKG